MGILTALLLFVDQLGTRRLDQGAPAQQIVEMVGRSLPRYVDVKKLRELAPPVVLAQKAVTINAADWLGSGLPVLGMNGGPVILAFFDPNCSHCDGSFAAFMRLAERYRERARFMVLPCALWEYSMLQIQALGLAHRENRYFDMWSAQFGHRQKGGLGFRDLEKVFRELQLDTRDLKKRLEAELAPTQAFHRKVRAAGIKSTPSIFINGISTSARTEEALAAAIEEGLLPAPAAKVDQRQPAGEP
jgi:protein-disulfide isomerase